tara:strand:+ start:1778 stop:4102 length:2325 start_codon:yes stop_codon:yes gene_type:complete
MASQEQLNRQKESIKLEKEYQDSLSISAQLMRDIALENKNNNKLTGNARKVLASYNKELNERVNNLNNSQDIAKELVDIDKEMVGVQRNMASSTNPILAAKMKSLETTKEALEMEYLRVKAAEDLDRVQKGVAGQIISQIDAIEQFGSNIPIVGGMFNQVFGSSFDNLRQDVTEAGMEMVTTFGKGGMSFSKMSGAMTKFGGRSLMALLANPMVLAGIAIAGIAAGIALVISAFSKLDAAAKAFREETGLTNSQMVGLDSTIRSVSVNNAALGVSMEDVSKAAAEFTKEFEGLMIPSAAVLDNVTALEKNFGVTASTQAKVNSLFQETAGLSAEAAQFQVAQVTQAANLAGVAPTRVLEDIANSAEAASNYFGGSVEELSKAAIKAAALGTSIKQASEVADNLMDFESSITNELEASAMLGQTINFNKARELAATGDIVGAQQAVLDSLESTVDLNKLNKFQLDSIAKASGMPVAELKKQFNLRKQFGKLDEAGMKAAENLLASGKELKDIGDDELAAATAQVRAQDEMKSRMDKLKAVFGGIGTTIMAALAPLGELLITPLISLGKIILPAFQLIGKVLGLAFKPVLLIFRLLQKVVDPIIDAFAGMFSELDPFFAKMDEMYTQLEEGMGPVFTFIGEVLGTVFSLIGMVIGLMVDGFMLLYDYVIAPIISVISSIGSFLGFGGDDEEPVAMATGGVVTKPTNAIIGEAGPEAVIPLDRMGGMGSNAMVAAITQLGNEIKNLQVQVNLDGKKVSDGVSKVVSRNQTNSAGVTK